MPGRRKHGCQSTAVGSQNSRSLRSSTNRFANNPSTSGTVPPTAFSDRSSPASPPPTPARTASDGIVPVRPFPGREISRIISPAPAPHDAPYQSHSFRSVAQWVDAAQSEPGDCLFDFSGCR